MRRYIKLSLTKLSSRKLLVFLIATHAMYTHHLDADQWFLISMLYLGVQGGMDWYGKYQQTLLAQNSNSPRKSNDTTA